LSSFTGAPETISDFVFDTVLFTSPFLDRSIELKNNVTDLEIFEDLNFPYLTGRIMLVDDSGFLTNADVIGGETIFIKITCSSKDAKPFSKTFYISEILSTSKVNEISEGHIFNLIEDIGFESNLQNLNKSYNGKCGTIIEKIASNFLNKDITKFGVDTQSVKLIVPNLSPIEAMMWIRDRATTINGYPFYLFSTLITDTLKYVDLGTLINTPVINPDVPYRYSSTPFFSDDETAKRRILLGFDQNEINNLYRYIQRGLIGAQYEYIDTVKNRRNTFQFDVTKDLLDPLVKNSVLPRNQNNIMYGPRYKLNEKPYNQLSSRKITRIGGSSAYVDQTSFNSYKESELLSDYKNNVTSQAMKELLANAPITFAVKGLDFIGGEEHSTVGNNLRIHFTFPNPDPTLADQLLDQKKSGDYLIFATHHTFKKDTDTFKHYVKMTGSKLANYTDIV